MVRYLDVSAVLDIDRPQPERCYMTSVALDVLEGKLRESMEQVLKHGEKFRKHDITTDSALRGRSRRTVREQLTRLASSPPVEDASMFFRALLMFFRDIQKPRLVHDLYNVLQYRRRITLRRLIDILLDFLSTAGPENLSASLRHCFETYVKYVLKCSIVDIGTYKEERQIVERVLASVGIAGIDVEDVVQIHAIARHMSQNDIRGATICTSDSQFHGAIHHALQIFPEMAPLNIKHSTCKD